MTTKIKHICATCKSDDVVLDAWAEWDVMIQDWVLRSVFDDAFCLSCEQACDLEEVEIEGEAVSMDMLPPDKEDEPVFTLPRKVVLEDLPESDIPPEQMQRMIHDNMRVEYEHRIEDDNPDKPVKYVHRFIDGDEIGEPNAEVKRAIAELLSKKP